jgi:hypothetical protein
LWGEVIAPIDNGELKIEKYFEIIQSTLSGSEALRFV